MSYFLAVRSLGHVMLREFDAAIDCARRAIQESPNNPRAWHRLVCALGHKGEIEEARRSFEESKRLLANPTTAFFDATYPFTDPDDRAFFLDGLRKAGWQG